LSSFHKWLTTNYDPNWNLVNLVKRGFGIHNGQLHRSLSQIQVKLFEEDDGIERIVSTSSIIEGVNTSAENVIIWQNKNGRSRLNDFTYKNIIGRGGRMFKHFIGKIYILEQPPDPATIQLNLPFPEKLVGDFDEVKYAQELTREQIIKIIAFKEEMAEIFGHERFQEIQEQGNLILSDSYLLRDIALDMKNNPRSWSVLSLLNSSDVNQWDSPLYKVIRTQPGNWGIQYSKFVGFVKILSKNWQLPISVLLNLLETYDISVNDFFKLERSVTFDLASLLNDINILQRELLKEMKMDISPFISKCSHAFLPQNVFQLEEYGLPRMISKKIQNSGVFDFLDQDTNLHSAISQINEMGIDYIFESVGSLDHFDKYILEYFFDGIAENLDDEE